MAKVLLKPGKEKLPTHGHPWVFSGAIERTVGNPGAGEVLGIEDASGRFVAWGQFSPHSQIRIRLMEWDVHSPINPAWYTKKIQSAVDLRKNISPETDSYRVVFSESDGVPGLIADKLGPVLMVQFLTCGADKEKAMISKLLLDLVPGVKSVWEKSDGDGRRMEGLPLSEGLLAGDPVSGPWEIKENGLRYLVDTQGQKTGFYTDQRENRQAWAPWTKGRRVLDAFSFTGGFGLSAAAAGATSVTLLDGSDEALSRAKDNFQLNGHNVHESLQGDAFEILRMLKTQGQRFGAISLDPPKLVPSKTAMEKGRKAYKDLNLQALGLLEPGGVLATFSCSGLISAMELKESLIFAARDAGKKFQILQQFHQAPCHPILSSFPEGEYLKGFLVRVL